ncbi:MAG TPA: ClpXP protease specificity-enhancing factor [Gammaproteobacteria bacterium]|nr:ClpXP protease specificity-enhancing factor [Gammaproteobacteria bacterium]
MLSNRPYLLRAFYQWIIDSACVPILVIDVNHPRSRIPKEYADGAEIVFNISSTAVRDLKISNELIEFKASFSGVIHIISAPIKAVLAIYAEENGEGIFFDGEDDEDGGDVIRFQSADRSSAELIESEILLPPPNTIGKANGKKGKPVLKLVE